MRNKFIEKIVNYILERRRNRLEKTLKKLNPSVCNNKNNKTLVTASEIMTLTSHTEQILEQMDFEVKNIVKICLNNPEKLLNYVNEHGTPVHKIPFADLILSKINEEEGFVIPLTGFRAFYLNFFVGILSEKKIKLSFHSPAMFILRDKPVNVYYMLHQFHKWYGFKKNLPGYDEKAQQLFKENISSLTGDCDLSVDEIIALKDAIARDAQAAEFVIQLAKESDGARKALDKIKNDGGAEI